MPEHKLTKKRVKRTLKWILAALALAIIAALLWVILAPMLASGTAETYQSYTVETGDISTVYSFSATLSVKKSETFTASETSTVRTIYVQSGDTVQKGDQLMQLSTGEMFIASFEGVVNEIRVKAGDWLWPNFSVLQVSDLVNLKVSMDVDEYDVEKLSVGQSCTVEVISLGVTFETEIAHINRVSQSSGTVAYYSVTCDLTVPETILPGMQATVTVPAEEALQVTTLSMAAIAFDEDEAPYVLMKDSSGTYIRHSIELGISDGMKVAVVSGLTPGETVYALSGEESAQSTLTLTDIYTYLFGKKTVINDMTSVGGGRGEMPDFSAEGMTMPEGSTEDMPMPDFDAASMQAPGDSQTLTTGDAQTDEETAAADTQTQAQAAQGDQAVDATSSGIPDGQASKEAIRDTQPTAATDGEGETDVQ